MQGSGDLFWQEVFAEQCHHLANFHHRTFQAAQLFHQLLGTGRQDFLAPVITFVFSGEQCACTGGGILGPSQKAGFGH